MRFAGKKDFSEDAMNRDIAFCGVDCSVCPDYISKKCPSCRLTRWKDGDICMPVMCCREKGIDFCAFCGEFPCGDMADFYGESDSHKAAYRRMLAVRAGAPQEK